MTVTTETAAVRPDYKALARQLLDEIRTFFNDPEHEAEFAFPQDLADISPDQIQDHGKV